MEYSKSTVVVVLVKVVAVVLVLRGSANIAAAVVVADLVKVGLRVSLVVMKRKVGVS
jgi:hypothetical protein